MKVTYSNWSFCVLYLTSQCKHLVPDVDGRIMLTTIQRILAPGAQELFHGQYKARQSVKMQDRKKSNGHDDCRKA